jgi:hypothetical protein
MNGIFYALNSGIVFVKDKNLTYDRQRLQPSDRYSLTHDFSHEQQDNIFQMPNWYNLE